MMQKLLTCTIVYTPRLMSMLLGVTLISAPITASARVEVNFDFDWLFKRGPDPHYNPTPPAPGASCLSSFFINLNGQQCQNLNLCQPGQHTPDSCAQCCCQDDSCGVWQLLNDTKECYSGRLQDCSTQNANILSGGRIVQQTGYQPQLPGPQNCPAAPSCVDYDDKNWRQLHVPHDFIVEGNFTPNADRGHGYLPFDIGWYRKHFTVPSSWRGQNIWIDFDGVGRASDYFLNGQFIGHHESGYTPFRWYIHNASNVTLNYDADNVLAVRCDTVSHQEGWFYEGGGIYRHTTLNSADPVSIVPWGIYAPVTIDPTAVISGTLDGPQSATSATMNAFADVANAGDNNATVVIAHTLVDAQGHKVALGQQTLTVVPGGFARTNVKLKWPVAPPQDGYRVQVASCTGSAEQTFAYNDRSESISILGTSGEELCLDARDATQPGNPPITVHKCDASLPSQKWRFNAAAVPCAQGQCINHIYANGNVSADAHCLDVYGVSGPALDVYPCVNQPSQQFTVDTTLNVIRVNGQCLEAQPSTEAARAAAAMPSVQLWNLARPYLYTLSTTLSYTSHTRNGTETMNTTIGVRSAVFSADKGLLLNGLPQKIKGLSMHQDVGGCGVAVPDAVNEYRVQSLLQMGATGWRTAHNPVNKELLDFTDRLGMLVWSENRNLIRPTLAVNNPDHRARTRQGTPQPNVGFGWTGVDPLYLEEVQAMVLRDRNHPSIIIWSLCNEGGCLEGSPDGGYIAAAFKTAIFSADSSRPVTANSEDKDGDTLTKVMDVNSFSYNYQEYDEFHAKYPFRAIIGGESASCTSDRGTYLEHGVHANQTTGKVDGSDTSCIVSAWGTSAGTRPWVAGNFAWTGWDYKGEPTPTNWPSINSHFGILDIAGFPKDDYYYYAAWWRNDTSVLHVVPQDWNAPVAVGATLNAVVYSAGSVVELFVNDVSQGKQPVPPLGLVTFPSITFKPGSLRAVSMDLNGNVLATTTVKTTLPASKIMLTVDSARGANVRADGQDVVYVRVAIVDANGTVVPNASNRVAFTVEGPGSVYGVANGDPNDHNPDKASYRNAFKGLARVIVESVSASPGTITLHATAEGLTAATLSITAV
eukprot:m.618070 g.618070  ORF g.618070 m.618070 type:complete len:1098 (+) comp22526_c0_seq2:177-3470(+)